MRSTVPHIESTRHGAVHRWVAAAVTMLILVAIFVMLTIYRPVPWLRDHTSQTSSVLSYEVSQTQLTTYCPARMSIADTGSYGDTQYQASSGNVTSSARYAAFGSIYASTISSLAANGSDDIELEDPDILDQTNIKVASGDVNAGPRLVDTRMLTAQVGTGVASSVASWATQGDLSGLSASSCIIPELTQSFLLAATGGGQTQQLTVANTSAKATSVDVTIWGTTQSGTLDSALGSSLSIAAHSQSVLDLGAAAPKENGLFVTVSSAQTPVAAVVRTVRMDGLTVKGSDYVPPVTGAKRHAVMPAVKEGDKVTLFVFADKATTARMSWIGTDGAQPEQRRIAGGRVSVIDLGKAPKDATGVALDADSPVRSNIRVTNDGADGQEDFAFVPQASPVSSSAVVLPDDIIGEMTFINTTGTAKTATVHAYSGTGKQVGTRTVKLDAGADTRISGDDISPDARLFMVQDADGVVWGMRLSRDDVTEAKLAGVAYIAPQSLDVHSERVWVRPDQGIVR